MTSIKHSIRYFGIADDGSRVPCTKTMKGSDWGWDATCACGWDSRTGGVIHARIVELVAAHKAEILAIAADIVAPVTDSSSPIAETYAKLTAKGKAVMAMLGDWHGSFFDDGCVEGSGAWGEVLSSEACVTATKQGMAGVLTGLRTAGVLASHEGDEGDDSDWWYLTALGAEVAKFAAAAAK